MSRIAPLLFAVLIAATIWGQSVPVRRAPRIPGVSVTYDLRETWDTTGTPGTDGTWTTNGDPVSINFNFTDTTKQGAQCLAFEGPTAFTYVYTNLPSSSGTWYGRGWFRSSNMAVSPRVATLSEVGVGDRFFLIAQADGKLWAGHGTKSNVTAMGQATINTWYAYKFKWVKGAGSGIYQVWWGADENSLTLVIDQSDGDSNTNPLVLSHQAESSVGVTNYWDDIRLKTSDF